MTRITNEVLAERIDNFKEYMIKELKDINEHLANLNNKVAQHEKKINYWTGIAKIVIPVLIAGITWGLFR
tara:strand:+ start:913 stop:1122 length:210 start_codon:yes stop_codon:yes gene_type:complete